MPRKRHFRNFQRKERYWKYRLKHGKFRSHRAHSDIGPRKRMKTLAMEHTVEHKIAFLGNPNVGKSSLFNILTHSHQHIGNWPGKTVERKEGHFILSDEYFAIVDLPGTYSLSARSEEEVITRKFILDEEPDLVCVIVDAMRLERTLYLATQAMELTKRVAIIINMMDVAEKEGITINASKLEESLGVPVLLVSALEDYSILRIKKFLFDALHTDKYNFYPAQILYSPKIEYMLQDISKQIESRGVCSEYPSRWLACRVLENELSVVEQLEQEFDLSDVFRKIDDMVEKEKYDPAIEISKIKFLAIHKIVASAVSGLEDFKESLSDKIDKVAIHKIWGYPILFAIFATFFLLTFYASTPIINGMNWLFEKFSTWLLNSLVSINGPPFLTSLIVDGIVAGIAAVLLFIPIILIFYGLLAIMEDSGYLARTAYLMDRIMGKFGLQGTAFMSIIMGFGCNVAGILSARTIKNEKDKLAMILTNSFIPCAARIGVIAFLTGIFFQPWLAALVMFSLTGLSLILVLISSLLFGLFYKKEQVYPLILELPDYKHPRFRNVFYLTRQRTGIFVKKAGTFIFVASIFIWFISNIPFGVPPEQTIVGYIGRGLSFITEPLFGFTWKMVVPLIFGIAAKETIISALGIIYSNGGGLINLLRASWSIPQALSFLVFQLSHVPCFATIASIKKETKSWKYTALGIFYPLFLTSIITIIVFHTFTAII
jgi:ferrous iron transport protein B